LPNPIDLCLRLISHRPELSEPLDRGGLTLEPSERPDTGVEIGLGAIEIQCCWANCEATENLEEIKLWGTAYCPGHIAKARERARSAAKGPAFTDRHIAPPAPSEPDQLELLAHTQEEK